MLIGLDSSADRDQQNMGARNDTDIVLSLDFDSGTARMLAVPRDTIVQVPHLDSKGMITGYATDRINTAFGTGGGSQSYGFENVMSTASSFLSCGGKYSIPIQYYMSIDLDGIIPICDAVGGVPLTLTSDFPGLSWKAGQQVVIQGEVAQEFLRWRHPDQTGEDTGDIGRGLRQQQFLVALAEKIKQMGPVETVQKLFGSMQQYMSTNMNLDQIIALAQTLKGMNLSDIQIASVDGQNTYVNSAWKWAPDLKQLPKTVQQIFYS